MRTLYAYKGLSVENENPEKAIHKIDTDPDALVDLFAFSCPKEEPPPRRMFPAPEFSGGFMAFDDEEEEGEGEWSA